MEPLKSCCQIDLTHPRFKVSTDLPRGCPQSWEGKVYVFRWESLTYVISKEAFWRGSYVIFRHH